MSGRPNLLELCLSPDLGGLELYMARCAQALSNEFDVVKVIDPRGKLFEHYGEDKNSFSLQRRSKLFLLNQAKALAKIIDDNQIEIIHMHWTKDLPLAVLAKLFSKQKPKLVQTRHMTMTRFKNDIYHRFLYKNMDMILPVTKQLAEQIKRFVPENIRPKTEVLYIGSDAPELISGEQIQVYRKTLGVTGDALSIGMVGRIEEPKGQYLLIEAMAQLERENIAAKVFFVGHAMQESYQAELEVQIKEAGLEEKVVFLGFTKEPQRFMQACDIVVLATQCETFGLVLIEAMQVGTAVVATKSCGPLEIIEDGVSGLLFEKGSSKDLAEKIKSLTDKTRRTQIADAGKQRAEEMFSSDKQFNLLAKLLKNI